MTWAGGRRLKQVSGIPAGMFGPDISKQSIITLAHKRTQAFVIFLLFLLPPFSLSIFADSIKFTTGAEYVRGDYGADANIEEWYVPVTGKYITEQYAFRITLPWVRLTAPAGTTLGDSQLITTGDGAPVTTQGVGDMVASVTRYDLLGTETVADVSLDLTGKVKFATADTGLGTGENDYTVQAALYKSWEQLRSYAIAGYTLRGEPPGIDLRDVWSGVAGGRYRFTAVFDAGLDVYYRQASLSSLSNQKELTALLGVRLDADQKLQFYVLHGLDDGSPDWGAGLMFTVTQ